MKSTSFCLFRILLQNNVTIILAPPLNLYQTELIKEKLWYKQKNCSFLLSYLFFLLLLELVIKVENLMQWMRELRICCLKADLSIIDLLRFSNLFQAENLPSPLPSSWFSGFNWCLKEELKMFELINYLNYHFDSA